MNCGNRLTVLRGLNGNTLIYSLLHRDENEEQFLGELYACGGERDLFGCISEIIVCDSNALSFNCANGTEPSDYVKTAFYRDVKTIFSAATRVSADCYALGAAKYGLDEGIKGFARLSEFYRRNGYGKFIKNKAFRYADGELQPIKCTSMTKLENLKGYESEKSAIIFNVENFLNGLPFSDTLLYGDRGTGKSSTVQAILNEYSDRGLRLIQLDKSDIGELDAVRELLRDNPLKFIIFADDLSLDSHTPGLSAFNAALDGSVTYSPNSMVLATSNRRHLLTESYTERQNDLHPEDAIQDSISLSDRFGLTVLFTAVGKDEYLSIVRQLCEQSGIREKNMAALAERWAILKGGRSPRAAKQLCDYAVACERRNLPIDF